MKKLSLKKLNLGADELLQKEQLKTVFGGYGSGCFDDCKSDSDCSGECPKCYITQGGDGGCGT
ncbi:hypothetical protein BUL40_09355 [Croceivirga radicis]|uniref:Uncharacterized protein n=1 Tax=Croceivirga radicis TaxID=1929488 RepID=A0A1V6LRP3_9FLAO|nr:hypothetical protein [Croceivirga radicis]OQD42717.1 hypothetical protein BUL40_09355 [Croceivirga radicis]